MDTMSINDDKKYNAHKKEVDYHLEKIYEMLYV